MASINASGINSLFSSSTSSSSWLTDYMTIKNGSYKKLLKAQYANEAAEKGTSSTGGSTSSSLTSVQKNELLNSKTDADSLRTAASKLSTRGSKSLFKSEQQEVTDEETGETKLVNSYDMDAIADAVKSFADSYNKVVDSSLTPSNAQLTKKAAVMINTTKMNKSLLADIGITIGSNYKLTIDEEKLKKADINKVMSLFNGTGSYASQISTKASEISSIASKVISNASTGYGSSGRYRSHVQSGTLFSEFL